MNWKRSSLCESSTCVEVSLPQWRAPSGCGDSDSCVEVLMAPGRNVLIRDSRGDVILKYTPEEWRAFIAGAKAGEFDID